MSIDFKKTEKELYQPKTTPSIIDVPEMIYISQYGKGDPNGGEFQTAAELLYSLAYAVKMSNKDILEYVVPPLEGIWWAGCDIADKSKYEWVIMLRQPDFVTTELFETAKDKIGKKKKHLDVSKAHLEEFAEGLCVQAMHIGAYDEEPVTINVLEKFANEAGYCFDIADDSIKTLSRRHHEIYLSNPKKTPTQKMKTVIRYPITRIC